MLLPNQLVANDDHLRGFGFVTWEYPIWAQLGIIDEHVIFMFIYVVYRLYLSIIDYLSVFMFCGRHCGIDKNMKNNAKLQKQLHQSHLFQPCKNEHRNGSVLQSLALRSHV